MTYALLFVWLALVAEAFGVYRVAAVPSEVAWLLFAMWLVLLVPPAARYASAMPGRPGSWSGRPRAR